MSDEDIPRPLRTACDHTKELERIGPDGEPLSIDEIHERMFWMGCAATFAAFSLAAGDPAWLRNVFAGTEFEIGEQMERFGIGEGIGSNIGRNGNG